MFSLCSVSNKQLTAWQTQTWDIFVPYFIFFWIFKIALKNQRVPNFPWNQRGTSPPFPNVTQILNFSKSRWKQFFWRFIPLLHLHFPLWAKFSIYFLLIATFHGFFFRNWDLFLNWYLFWLLFIEKLFHASQKILIEKRRQKSGQVFTAKFYFTPRHFFYEKKCFFLIENIFFLIENIFFYKKKILIFFCHFLFCFIK